MTEERSRDSAVRGSRIIAKLAKLPKAVLWLLGLIVFLILAYLIGANWFLNSDWGKAKLNRKPEKLSLQWESAWTWFPGVVRVSNLHLEGHNRRADWSAVLDRGQVWIWLPSLIRRHLNVVRFAGGGSEVEVAMLAPPDQPRPEQKKRGWRITLGGLAIDDLRRVRFDPYQVSGEGGLRGRVDFEVRESVAFDVSKLGFNGAVITSGDEVAAEGVELDAALQVDEFLVGDDTFEDLLAELDIDIELTAESAHLGFLDAYLANVPMLQVGGRGPLTLDIEVTDGWLAPDSHFRLDGPIVSVEYAGLRAVGNGEVVGEVLEETHNTVLRASLDAFSIYRPADAATLAQGENLSARITNDSTAIDRPAEGVAVEVSLPPARVPDLSAFSAYIPVATGLSLTGGEATFAAELAYDSIEQSGNGSLRLTGEGIDASYTDLDLVGDLDLRANFPVVEMDDGKVSIAGTELNITDVTIRSGGKERPWWGKVHVDQGAVEWTPRPIAALGRNREFEDTASAPEADSDDNAQSPSEPVVVSASVEADLLDTTPVTAMIEQRAPRLGWFDQILTVENVSVSAQMRLEGQDVSLRNLELNGGRKGRLELLGQLDLHEKEEEGVLFARFGLLTAAVALDPGERDWKLTGSRAWYEEQARQFRSAQ